MFYVFNCAHCFGEKKKLNIELNFPIKCTINGTHNFMNFWSVPIMGVA